MGGLASKLFGRLLGQGKPSTEVDGETEYPDD